MIVGMRPLMRGLWFAKFIGRKLDVFKMIEKRDQRIFTSTDLE